MFCKVILCSSDAFLSEGVDGGSSMAVASRSSAESVSASLSGSSKSATVAVHKRTSNAIKGRVDRL